MTEVAVLGFPMMTSCGKAMFQFAGNHLLVRPVHGLERFLTSICHLVLLQYENKQDIYALNMHLKKLESL